MSIATKTGDDGTTALMFGRRVTKGDLRVEAYGTVDELNAAIGLARAGMEDRDSNAILKSIQLQLVDLMGEMAVLDSDLSRYKEKGFRLVDAEMVESLDKNVEIMEKREGLRFDGWATPGDNPLSASLDYARTICRRAERRVVELDTEVSGNPEMKRYLNRLSDLLWLLARRFESHSNKTSKIT